jgi:hypothetical protein
MRAACGSSGMLRPALAKHLQAFSVCAAPLAEPVGRRLTMDDSVINLKPVLLGDGPDVAVSACVNATVARTKTTLGTAPAIDWPGLADAVADRIEDMFDIPLLGLFTDAWKDFHELADAADTDRHGPDELLHVALIDHAFEASFTPHVDVEITGMKAVRVDFEIAAGIELEGVELEIRGGVMRAVRLGSVAATASAVRISSSCRAKSDCHAGSRSAHSRTLEVTTPNRATLVTK